MMLASALLFAAAGASAGATVASTARRFKPSFLYGPAKRELSAEDFVAFKPLPVGGASRQAKAERLLSKRSTTGSGGFCQPGEPCWPAPSQWAALNATLGGRLTAVEPECAPCYIDASSPQCQAAANSWTDPYWRAAQPAAMQDPWWEVDQQTGAACFYGITPTCSQGAVPPYAVAVASAGDVAAALSFASEHAIQVAVRASGHEFQGRSTAQGALLIWLHTLAGFTVDESFAACPGDVPHAAVTVLPGTGYGEVYAALNNTYTLVGGSARTVSAAGGHALGGGHSFASPSLGLTADNVLAAQVVLANGTLVTASPCSNPDLFWALRGGGGGSFGVVTALTHALHAVPAVGVTGLLLEVVALQGGASLDLLLNGFLAFSPGLLNATQSGGVVASGYWSVSPISSSVRANPAPAAESSDDPAPSSFFFGGQFLFNGSVAAAQAASASFATFLQSYPSDLYVVTANWTAFPSMNAWHDSIDAAESGDRTGSFVTLGSRLVPAGVCGDATLRANASLALTIVASYVPLSGMMTCPPVGSDPLGLTSVTPAWRAAVHHVTFGGGWEANATLPEVAQVFAGMSSLTDVLRQAWPDSGAYFSESDHLEDDWSTAFWGDANYARLQAIKAAYDPAGVFTCHHCVQLPDAIQRDAVAARMRHKAQLGRHLRA